MMVVRKVEHITPLKRQEQEAYRLLMCIDLNEMSMNELVDAIIVFIVFRIFFYIVEVWWNGDERNDFRRDK